MLSHRPGTPSERGHKICSILVSAIECSPYLTESCYPAVLLFFLVIFLFLSLFYLSFIPSISLLLYLSEVFVHYYLHTTISLDFFLPSSLSFLPYPLSSLYVSHPFVILSLLFQAIPTEKCSPYLTQRTGESLTLECFNKELERRGMSFFLSHCNTILLILSIVWQVKDLSKSY